VHPAALNEPELNVEADRVRVVGMNVQERRFAPRRNAINQQANKTARQAPSGGGGMRAYGADFGKARHLEALAGHGHELTVAANSEILAEFMRAHTERPRLGERGERRHGRRVGRRKQFRPYRRGRRATGPDHLRYLQGGRTIPACLLPLNRLRADQDCRLAVARDGHKIAKGGIAG